MASSLLLYISLLSFLPLSALAQSTRNITVGAFLTADQNSSSWVSPSGEFAFGFQELKTSKDLFVLCIWYAKIPEKTVAWYANGDNPAPKGSRVVLTDDRGLVLSDPQGKELWKSATTVEVVGSAVMADSGNFVIQDGSFNVLWESFSNPADTILPAQVLDKGMAVSSRQSETNFSKGRFQLLLQNDGNLVISTLNLPSTQANEPYFATGTDSGVSSSSPGYQLVFNGSGYLFVLRENNQTVPLAQGSIASTRDFYHRATLNFDGVFVQYYRRKTSSGNDEWTPLWSKPDNICQASSVSAGSGTCGFNSICRLNAEKRPSCECPEGYSLLDPNNLYGSCKPNYTQSCEDKEEGPLEELYRFEELQNTDWPSSDYALLKPFTEELCRQSCLQDCMCDVAIFRSGDMCWKKKLPLSNGRVDPNLDGKALLKVRIGKVDPRYPNLPIPEQKQKRERKGFGLVGSVFLGFSLLANGLLVMAICLGFFLIYKKKTKPVPGRGGGDDLMQRNLMCFTYKELVEATNGFMEELGKGAFGVVYKGSLKLGSNSHSQIAVKKLHTVIHDGLKEFKAEVNAIGQTHHKNLVKLLGFCKDGDQHLLVYEFLSNGTLSNFLFGDQKPGWNKRINIAFGIARGLVYLHEECSTQIIHCDIKPQNILLDEYNNAKISDFGLAKLLLMDQSQTQTAIRGTKGYVAPEWFRNWPITVKVDVYSYGVLLLEIICCRKSVDIEEKIEERAILIDWAYDCFVEGKLEALVEGDTEAMEDQGKLERFVKIAIWCIQEDPGLRPNMRQVIQMLEGIVEVPVPPCPSPFALTTETTLAFYTS